MLKVLCLFLLLYYAPIAAEGASDGLILWFRHVLPVLMPFTLIVQVMMADGTVLRLGHLLSRPVHKIFGFSPVCSFCILTGFLCGFPMGAVTASHALKEKLIRREEAQLLAGTCNNAGPMFVSSYVLSSQIDAGAHRLLLTLIFYGSAFLWMWIRSRFLLRSRTSYDVSPTYASGHPSYRKILLDSSELMLKVGIFMMLFAIIIAMLFAQQWIPGTVTAFLAILLEITNGIAAMAALSINNQIKTALIMAGTAFGGLCIAAQTYTVIHAQKLSFVKYLFDKAAISLLTGALTLLYLYNV